MLSKVVCTKSDAKVRKDLQKYKKLRTFVDQFYAYEKSYCLGLLDKQPFDNAFVQT